MKINLIKDGLERMMELDKCDYGICMDTQNVINDLERIIKDTLWMARRYADGRSTYAPETVNKFIDLAIELGIDLDGPPEEMYARDGMFGEWDSKLGVFKNEKR
jgi:hypothetical protein